MTTAIAWDPFATANSAKRVPLQVFALAGASLIAQLAFNRQRITPEGVPKLWVALGLWALSSLLWAPNLAGSLDATTWLAGLVLLLVSSQLPSTDVRAGIVRGAMVAGIVTSSVATFQWITGARGVYAHGLQGNANWLGLLLALTLPLTVEGLRDTSTPNNHPWRRRMALTAIALQLLGLGLSGSRTAWLATIVGGVAGWLSWRRIRTGDVPPNAHSDARWPGKLAAAALIASLALLITFGSAWTGNVPWLRGLRGRLLLDQISWQAGIAHLPVGTGLGGFASAFARAQGQWLQTMPIVDAARSYQHALTAHNDVLQAFVELGPLGALLLIAAWLNTARAAWKAKRPGIFAAWIALGVTSLADSPLHSPAIVTLAALLAGTQHRSSDEPTKGTESSPHRRPFAALSAALAAVLVLSTTVSRATSSWLCERTVTKAQSALPSRQISLLTKATHLDPTSPRAWLALGLAQLRAGSPSDALFSMSKSTRLTSDPHAHVALGNAHVALGQLSQAQAAYQSALRQAPGLFMARLNLAETLRKSGDLNNAQIQANLAAKLYPYHPKLRALTERIAHDRFVQEK